MLELLLVAALIPEPLQSADVDVLELNHRYTEHSDSRPDKPKARIVLSQWIAWQYYPHAARHHVRAWKMVRGSESAEYSEPQQRWLLFWCDGNRIVLVRARTYRETWTRDDPEIEDRKKLCQERRMGL